MNNVFRLSSWGTSFATRTRAEELADELVKMCTSNPSQHLIIDFTNVSVITPSFATAFISRLNALLNHPEFKKDCIDIMLNSPLVRDRLLDVLHRHASHERLSSPKHIQSLEDRILVGQ